MKIITFNILKPLALSALFIVFAAGFNTAEAKKNTGICVSGAECLSGDCQGLTRLGKLVILRGTCAAFTCMGDCQQE